MRDDLLCLINRVNGITGCFSKRDCVIWTTCFRNCLGVSTWVATTNTSTVLHRHPRGGQHETGQSHWCWQVNWAFFLTKVSRVSSKLFDSWYITAYVNFRVLRVSYSSLLRKQTSYVTVASIRNLDHCGPSVMPEREVSRAVGFCRTAMFFCLFTCVCLCVIK